jgi:hypothetical protein
MEFAFDEIQMLIGFVSACLLPYPKLGLIQVLTTLPFSFVYFESNLKHLRVITVKCSLQILRAFFAFKSLVFHSR